MQYNPWNWRGPSYHAPFSQCSIDPLGETSKIQIEDIAHSLAMENRFNGCTYVPYSVASHCLNCVQYVASTWIRNPAILLNVLLHDAEEAVYRDLPTWLKREPAMEAAYVDPSIAFRHALFDAWGVEWKQDEEIVKRADNAVGALEYIELVIGRRARTITVRSWQESRDEFIAEFWKLKGAV